MMLKKVTLESGIKTKKVGRQQTEEKKSQETRYEKKGNKIIRAFVAKKT